MSNYDDFFPATEASGSSVLVADDAITIGDTLSLTAIGKAKTISGTLDGVTANVGGNISENTATEPSCCDDTTNKKVISVYRDNNNSDFGTMVSGVVDPVTNTIAWSTPVVFESVVCGDPHCVDDPDDGKVIICYRNNTSNAGRTVVADASGANMTAGSPVSHSTNSQFNQNIWDLNAGKGIVAYRDGADSQGKARVISVSGTVPSFGTEKVITTDDIVANLGMSYDITELKSLLVFGNNTNTNGEGVVLTISGTDITQSSIVEFDSDTADRVASSYNTGATAHLVAYEETAVEDDGYMVVATIASGEVTFGTEVEFTPNVIRRTDASYDPYVDRNIVVWQDDTTNDVKSMLVSISGTVPTEAFEAAFGVGATTGNAAVTYSASAGKRISVYNDGTNTALSSTVFSNDVTTNADDYIGIGQASVADTANITVKTLGSVDENQSGLTITDDYFVGFDGSLQAFNTGFPAVGKALTATSILMDGGA